MKVLAKNIGKLKCKFFFITDATLCFYNFCIVVPFVNNISDRIEADILCLSHSLYAETIIETVARKCRYLSKT